MPRTAIAGAPQEAWVDALTALRAATGAAHVQLEQRLDLPSRLVTAAAYRDFLTRLYAYYRPLEDDLAPYAGAITGLRYEQRRKTPLLEADLRMFDRMFLPASIARAPVLPRVDSPAAALGILYVVEGATLGGKVIARGVFGPLGITATSGGSFFAAYGDTVGARWRSFTAVLTRESDGAATAAMCAAALDCFTTMEEWLCR